LAQAALAVNIIKNRRLDSQLENFQDDEGAPLRVPL